MTLPHSFIIQHFPDNLMNGSVNSMKYILVIFFSLATLIVVPSFGETMDDLVYRADAYYAKFTDVPFSGTITGSSQGEIKDG